MRVLDQLGREIEQLGVPAEELVDRKARGPARAELPGVVAAFLHIDRPVPPNLDEVNLDLPKTDRRRSIIVRVNH